MADRSIAHREREARGGQEGVAPVRHRGRAGVRRLAAEDHAVALDADGAEHRSDRQTEALEHRPLLDVQLEVGAHVAESAPAVARAVELDAVRADRVLEADSVGIREVAHRVGIERPAGRGGAEEAAAETRALLVGPVDERDGAGRRALRGDRAQRLERAHHAERAVQPAAVRHGVDVRADDHGLRPVAGEAGPEVAGLVDVDLHRQLGEASRSSPRAFSHSSVQHSRLAPPGPPGQIGERAQVGDGALRLAGDLHGLRGEEGDDVLAVGPEVIAPGRRS